VTGLSVLSERWTVTTLRAIGVVKLLGGSRVLRGVDASFGTGSVHVLEGANGSGKSTLLAILSGRLAPTTGRALLQEAERVVAEGAALREPVAWLGHELGLYPDLTAFENVALHAALRGVSADVAWKDVSEAVAIEPLRGRRPRTMSRGQRQRVALGRVLAGGPRVLLLDEPSTGLDVGSVERLVAVVRGLAERGTIVLAVTHDAAFVEGVQGRRWKLAGGKLETAGG
jgi:ABC-type multidrug transport system ATPase subunit